MSHSQFADNGCRAKASVRQLLDAFPVLRRARQWLRLPVGRSSKPQAQLAFFGMLATFAASETDVRRERQLEGIASPRGRACTGLRLRAGRACEYGREHGHHKANIPIPATSVRRAPRTARR